jgi:hypothetical protein
LLAVPQRGVEYVDAVGVRCGSHADLLLLCCV